MTGGRAYEIMNAASRGDYGIVVSCSTEDRSERYTTHRQGLPVEALAVVVAELDRRPGRWYVEAISSPDSIFRDIARDRATPDPMFRERNLLARLGRLDLLRSPLGGGTRRSKARLSHDQNAERIQGGAA